MKEIIDYIKQFLLFGNSSFLNSLGYTSDKQQWNNYRVVIVPNGLIGDQSVNWQDLDLVISPQVEQVNQTWIIYDDLIYLSLYCISLAGEHLERSLGDAGRDIHKRIPSTESAIGKKNFQLRPIVDEYATLVSRLVGATIPTPGIQNIVLTHDVDNICRYRHLRGCLGGLRRGQFVDVVKSISNRENDPLFTFNWMHEQDKIVESAEIIYFIKASDGIGYDYPQYNLQGNDFRALLGNLSSEKVKIGLHGSYQAAQELCYGSEKYKLEKAIKKKVTLHRNHYLRILSYEDLQCLVDAGITDDYSIGWADHVGFRLGTTRPVRWINPITSQLTDLVLHPQSIMDGTLSGNHYMNIQSFEKAFEVCRSVIETIERYNGELVMLWHNSTFAEQNYHKELYMNVINSLHKEKDNRMQKITEEEEQRLVKLGTGEELEFDRSKTFIDLFKDQVAKTPDAVAVVDSKSQITYKELDDASDEYAKTITPGTFVCLELPRVKEFVVAVLGIWKAGSAYVPIDTEYPEERKRLMREECDGKPLPQSDIAYMIYTSGSTGKPKGVMIGHKGLTNYIHSTIAINGVLSSDRISAYRSFSFDSHIEEFYPTLAVGATLYIIPEDIRHDTYLLYQFIKENLIDGCYFPTQLAELLYNSYNLPVRFIGAVGERLTSVISGKNGVQFLNTYGPTECTDHISVFALEEGREYKSIPIGRPLHNGNVYIMDKDNQLVAEGCVGELCFSSVQLAIGYYNNPELTAERFIEVSIRGNKKRIYKTGDLCRWNEDGLLEYIGRIDNQVKLRGFRIELGEIESAAMHVSGIKQAVAMVKNEKIVLYYTGEPKSHSWGELEDLLPSYMIPSAYVHLDAMPLTPNGKVDKKRLASLDSHTDDHRDIVMPSTPIEQRLCDAFREVLKIERVSVDDDFFQIGGDSLKSMILQVVCQDISLSGRDVFLYKTPRKIASALDNRDDELNLEQLPESVPLTMTQQGIFVDCMNHRGEPVYHITRLLRLPKEIDTNRLCTALERCVYAHPGLLAELFVNQEGILSQRNGSIKEFAVQVEEMSEKEFEIAKSRLFSYIRLTNSRLFKIRVIETPTFVYLFTDFHHIIFDGDSENIFFRDVQAVYNGEEIEVERFTPYHVSLLESIRRESSFMEECKQWYMQHYGDIESTSLPQSDVEPINDEDEEDIQASVMYKPLRLSSKNLATAAQKLGVTNNVLAITAFGMTLNRINGTDTSSFTTIFNGRDDYRFSNIVSMFVKTLPVVVCNHEKNPFESTKTQLNESIAHSLFSFADLCKNTAFDNRVSFVYLNGYSLNEYSSIKTFCGYKCDNITLNNHISNGPLLIHLLDDGKLEIRAEYQTNLFTEKKIMNIVDTFVLVLEEIIKKVIE